MVLEIDEKEAGRIVRDAMDGFPEASSPSLQCVSWNYRDCVFVFEEYTEDERGVVRHTVNEEQLVKGLHKLVTLALQGKYNNNDFPKGFEDVGNWDATDMDALVQCAIFNDVIYG